MKNLLFVPLIILVLYGCASSKTAKTSAASAGATSEKTSVSKFYDPTTWLLGYFNVDRLKSEPHSEWFIKEYNDYKFDAEVVNKLSAIQKEGITIKIVLGTWCPDSRKQVPRFMKIIDLWGFPVSEITFIGVDDAKISPVGEYEGLNIQRVPTFIFYKNNFEAGRIIENPETSLEQDMVNILK